MKQGQRRKLNELIEELKAIEQKIPEDPVKFFKMLEFQPTAYQLDLTQKFQNSQFIAARWARQTGKSHTIAALLLHYALTHPNTSIGIVGPSWRQTKLVIRRINLFLRKIPREPLPTQNSKRIIPQATTHNSPPKKRKHNRSFPKQPRNNTWTNTPRGLRRRIQLHSQRQRTL